MDLSIYDLANRCIRPLCHTSMRTRFIFSPLRKDLTSAFSTLRSRLARAELRARVFVTRLNSGAVTRRVSRSRT